MLSEYTHTFEHLGGCAIFDEVSRPSVSKKNIMPLFYFVGETHTLASALRPSLEELCNSTSDFASCTTPHPLDNFLEVDAPSAAVVRLALLDVKRKIRQARLDVQRQSAQTPHHLDSHS